VLNLISMKDKIWKYLQQKVVVRAYGIEYTGIFKGADQDWVFLQCETTWVQIPWMEITSFRPAEAGEEARIYRAIERESELDEEGKAKKKERILERELKLIKGEKAQKENPEPEKESEE